MTQTAHTASGIGPVDADSMLVGTDNALEIRKLPSLELEATVPSDGWFLRPCISPGGKWIAYRSHGGKDHETKLYTFVRVADGTSKRYDAPVSEWNFVTDDLVVVQSGTRKEKNRRAIFWDLDKQKAIEILDANHTSTDKFINGMQPSASPDGNYVAIDRNGLSLWDRHNRKWIDPQVVPGGRMVVTAGAFSPDGHTLAIAEFNGRIRFWSVPELELLYTYEGRTRPARDAVLNPDGRLVAIDTEHSVRVWDLHTGRQRFAVSAPQPKMGIRGAAFDATTSKLAVAAEGTGSSDKTQVSIYDPTTGVRLQHIQLESRAAGRPSYGPDGTLMLLGVSPGSKSRTLHRLDQGTGKVEAVAKYPGWGRGYSFDSSGRHLAIAGQSAPHHVRLYKADPGQSGYSETRGIAHEATGSEGAYDVAFSRDGKHIAVAWTGVHASAWAEHPEEGSISIYRVSDAKQVHGLRELGQRAVRVEYSVDGQYLFAAEKDAATGQTIIYRPSDYGVEHSLAGVRHVKSVPGGQYFVALQTDMTAGLWDQAKHVKLASFYAFDEDGFMTSTPDLFYTASQDAATAIAFRMDERAYPFEQFDLRRNRPDLVLEAMGHGETALARAYHRAFEKRVRKMGFEPEDLEAESVLPTLTIKDAAPRLTDAKTLRVGYAAAHATQGLASLNVYVNDVPISGPRGISLRKGKKKAVKRKSGRVEIPLARGRNKV